MTPQVSASPVSEKTPQKAARYVLALDLGSGSIKAAVVSNAGIVVSVAAEPVTTHLLPNGGAEQDPESWWQSALRISRSAIDRSGVPARQIIAVCCDSQWSLAVPVDDACRPVMNAIHWLDARGGRYNRKLIGGFPGIKGYSLFKIPAWIRLTGLVPSLSGVDSLGHVLFIKNELPGVYQKTHKFLEPMDFLTSRMAGKICATQKTMAPFMITDNRQWGTRQYSQKLLDKSGLDRAKFPELIANNGVVGPLAPDVAKTLGLMPETTVVAGIADSNASLIGSGAIRDFDAIIYIGTSQYLTFHVPYKKTNLLYMMTALPSPFPSRYYLLGEQGVGGRCLEFFIKEMMVSDDLPENGRLPADAYDRFNRLAEKAPPGSGGVIFLPWLNGSLVPDEDAYVRGGFINISLSTHRHHMARAVMEGLAFNNRWTCQCAEKYTGKSIDRFRFSGGGALSELWAQIHADVLNVPIHQVEDPVNATVRGCALLALTALGELHPDEISETIRIRRVFNPDSSNRAVYDKMYTQYRRLFTKNRRIFSALNK